MFANLSLGEHCSMSIPSITQKKSFIKEAKELLQCAHDLVKIELKNQVKNEPKKIKSKEEIEQLKKDKKMKQNLDKQIRDKLLSDNLMPFPDILETSDASQSMSKGAQLEQQGNIIDAIKQFEISIALEFFGFYPYERLMVLYHRYKMYDEEIRVINKTIEIQKQNKYNWDVDKIKSRREKVLMLVDK
jgi:tetratricopeptide (TPR) repeat protein